MIQILKKIFIITIFLLTNSAFAEKISNSKAKVGTVADGHKAALALDEILRAYGMGNVSFIRDHLDPHMIGFQKLLDDIVVETNQCKQLRVRLLDTQIQAGPDLVVIQSNWEKRCLQLPNFTAQLFKGHSTFLMHRQTSGWSVSAISGLSPLQPSLPTACTGRGCQ